SPYNVTYDGSSHTATGTAIGVNSEDLSSLLTLTGTTHTNAATYAGDPWSFAGNSNYNSSNGTVTDVISKAATTVTVTCPASVVYTGSAQTPCTASYSGAGGLTGTLTVSYTSNTNVGTATGSASFAGDANHNAASNSANFDITKAPSTTTVTCSTVTYDGTAQ